MLTLADFPITLRWPPRDPLAIQLYAAPTHNGVKVSIMLEETGLAYDAHYVALGRQEHASAAFLSLNPNGRIPAIIDPQGPNGAPLPLFESGAILLYLAEKTGLFHPQARRWEVTQWLMFQMGGIGPIFGQLGHYHAEGGRDIEDPRPKERFRAGSERLLQVMEQALADRDWIAGDYSIADMAICPWLRALRETYKAADIAGWGGLTRVPAYLDRFLARPAVQRGLKVPARPA